MAYTKQELEYLARDFSSDLAARCLELIEANEKLWYENRQGERITAQVRKERDAARKQCMRLAGVVDERVRERDIEHMAARTEAQEADRLRDVVAAQKEQIERWTARIKELEHRLDTICDVARKGSIQPAEGPTVSFDLTEQGGSAGVVLVDGVVVGHILGPCGFVTFEEAAEASDLQDDQDFGRNTSDVRR